MNRSGTITGRQVNNPLTCNSCIDLTLITQSMAARTQDWKRIFSTTSDHALIKFSICALDQQEYKYNYKTDWFKFRQDLTQKLPITPKEWAAETLDRETERITNTIMDL